MNNKQVAVVTGAGSGIGRATAIRLVADGYFVALCDQQNDKLNETMALLPVDACSSFSGDLTDLGDVASVAGAIVDQYATIDALVHCAGGSVRSQGEGLEAFETEFIASLRKNVLVAALLTEALKANITDERGRIVAISSIAAFRGSGLTYGAAKSALHGWAIGLATELGSRKITVNVIAPGYTEGTAFYGDRMTPERRQGLIDETLLKSAGQPTDVAALIGFLVSADAKHITAQVHHINGGALPR